LSERLAAIDASWIAGHEPPLGQYSAKTRYRQEDALCAITAEQDNSFELQFKAAQWAVTPGQSAVLYQGDVCLGGGIIVR
jgi:tRNA-specific 2-thiouridylase